VGETAVNNKEKKTNLASIADNQHAMLAKLRKFYDRITDKNSLILFCDLFFLCVLCDNFFDIIVVGAGGNPGGETE
jgi:hypothetical protein